jgi:hypothetical protein
METLMLRLFPNAPPGAALAAAALGAAVLLFPMAPARAQQNGPTVRPSVPLVNPTKRYTPVTLDFTLPAGFQLVGHPRIRIFNAKGQQVVLLPTAIDQRGPEGKGHRNLNTEDYPPGNYQLRVEISFVDAQGKKGNAVSPPSPLIVPKR